MIVMSTNSGPYKTTLNTRNKPHIHDAFIVRRHHKKCIYTVLFIDTCYSCGNYHVCSIVCSHSHNIPYPETVLLQRRLLQCRDIVSSVRIRVVLRLQASSLKFPLICDLVRCNADVWIPCYGCPAICCQTYPTEQMQTNIIIAALFLNLTVERSETIIQATSQSVN